MTPTIRTLVASLMIAAVTPIGLAALDLEQAAFAKNGNGGGNGGGHGGGNGGGKGGGNGGGNGHGKSSEAHGNAKAEAKATKAAKAEAAEDGQSDDGEGLAPNQLGKLNGVLHASPNAIAHASANSPIGTARAFGEALAGFLDSAEETPAEGEAPAEGEDTAEDEAPTIDDLAEMMAHMTNKPVTADQVQAVAEKVGIETTDEAPTDQDTTDEDQTADETTDDPTADDKPAALDQATAQEIADKTNEIHGFDTGDDATDGEDTADAGDTETGDTGDETVTN
jgi:hypothetical protein